MKKFLVVLLCGFGTIGLANAVSTGQSASMPAANPACKVGVEHMKASHEQLRIALDGNNPDPAQIGSLVIANHKYMKDFIAKNPECRHPRYMP